MVLPQSQLSCLLSGDLGSVPDKEKSDYKKRKLVTEVTDKIYTLTKVARRGVRKGI